MTDATVTTSAADQRRAERRQRRADHAAESAAVAAVQSAAAAVTRGSTSADADADSVAAAVLLAAAESGTALADAAADAHQSAQNAARSARRTAGRRRRREAVYVGTLTPTERTAAADGTAAEQCADQRPTFCQCSHCTAERQRHQRRPIARHRLALVIADQHLAPPPPTALVIDADGAAVLALVPDAAHRRRRQSVAAALHADGPFQQTDADPSARWSARRRRVASADAERHQRIPTAPPLTTDQRQTADAWSALVDGLAAAGADGGTVTALRRRPLARRGTADLSAERSARWQTARGADRTPVRRLTEASLWRSLDRRSRWSAGADRPVGADWSADRILRPDADGVWWRDWWRTFLTDRTAVAGIGADTPAGRLVAGMADRARGGATLPTSDGTAPPTTGTADVRPTPPLAVLAAVNGGRPHWRRAAALATSGDADADQHRGDTLRRLGAMLAHHATATADRLGAERRPDRTV